MPRADEVLKTALLKRRVKTHMVVFTRLFSIIIPLILKNKLDKTSIRGGDVIKFTRIIPKGGYTHVFYFYLYFHFYHYFIINV